MTKLPDTSETAIAITFLVINLSALLRQVLRFFFVFFGRKGYFSVLLLVQLMLCSDKSFNPYVLLALNS
jgi:hypothetical protein